MVMKSSNNYGFKGIISFILFSILFILINIGNTILRNDGQAGIPFDVFFSIIAFFGLLLLPITYFLLALEELTNNK